MTAEEIVMGGYAAFGAGDMEALSKVYHPDCKITFHANHALGGEYHGFNDLLGNMLAKLNDAWVNFISSQCVSNCIQTQLFSSIIWQVPAVARPFVHLNTM